MQRDSDSLLSKLHSARLEPPNVIRGLLGSYRTLLWRLRTAKPRILRPIVLILENYKEVYIDFRANDAMASSKLPSNLKAIDISLAAATALMCLALLAGSVSAASASPAITVSPTAAIVGASITVTGTGFAPNTNLALQWGSSNASWVVSAIPTPQVTGIKVGTFQRSLGSAATNSTGSFSAKIVVPSDFGGQHFVQAFFTNGTALAPKATFTVEPSFQFTPSSGPAGTAIKVVATGLSDSLYSTSYHLTWDNVYTGYATALSSGGATNFTIYASGTPGTHYIDIYQGYPGPGYLNPQQGPPASETQSLFPPYIPFHGKFIVTPQQVAGQPSTVANTGFKPSGSTAIGSLAVLLAALASGVLFLSKKTPEEREAISKAMTALVIIVLVAVAGVGLYAATAQQGATSSTTSTTQGSSTQASSGPQVSFTPVATVNRPQITVPVNTATTGPRISVTPTIASVGDNITVNGQGFGPNAQLPLTWSTRQGSNVAGYLLVNKQLRTVTAGADG